MCSYFHCDIAHHLGVFVYFGSFSEFVDHILLFMYSMVSNSALMGGGAINCFQCDMRLFAAVRFSSNRAALGSGGAIQV